MSDSIKKLDRTLYNVERTIVVTALVVMAIVVFLDVVHRTFSGEGSKLASALAKLAGMFGAPIPEESERFQALVDASPWVMTFVSIALGYFGVRSAKRAEPVPPAKAFAWAVAGLVVVYGLIRLVVVLMPNGFIWSQPLALVLTLWVGFVGASMCTYENKHLKVEAVQRILPPRIKPLVGFVSGVATALVCLALLWVSVRYVLFNYQEYVDTDGKGGLFQGMDVPKYLGFAALPISFLIMALRFGGKAIAALRGELEDDDPTGGLLAAAKLGASDDADHDPTLAPSDVETESVPQSGLRPSEVDTVSSSDRLPGGNPRPSQVTTQPHPLEELRAELRSPGQRAASGELGRVPMGTHANDEAGLDADADETAQPEAAAPASVPDIGDRDAAEAAAPKAAALAPSSDDIDRDEPDPDKADRGHADRDEAVPPAPSAARFAPPPPVTGSADAEDDT